MRKLAAIHLQSSDPAAFDHGVDAVSTWLRDLKGFHEPTISAGQETTSQLQLSDGRLGTITSHQIDTEVGRLLCWTIAEPTDGGDFRTTIQVATARPDAVSFYCTLEAGRPDSVVAPTYVPARVPRVVADVLSGQIEWRCGATNVSLTPLVLRDATGGRRLVDLLTAERSVPLVVISDYEGLVLHPGIETRMAADIAGLAMVIRINTAAAWEVTRVFGASMSCYHGAIRLYWPGSINPESFRRHPLWTSANLLRHTHDTKLADKQIRDTIRRLVFAASAMGIRRPEAIDSIERAHRRSLMAAAASASEHLSVEDLFAELDEKIASLQAQNDQLLEANTRLQTDLENERALRAFAEGDSTGNVDLIAADEAPPTTLEEAVRRAQDQYAIDLLFGSDVWSAGVPEMDADAGPPDKVGSHLYKLAQLAAEMRKGPLGISPLQWLRARGIPCSEEKQQTLANERERQRRTWAADGEKRLFSYHTKPNEGTKPSKCVRIYFDWDPVKGKIMIGWVGRHP